jgi:hypothetical protein
VESELERFIQDPQYSIPEGEKIKITLCGKGNKATTFLDEDIYTALDNLITLSLGEVENAGSYTEIPSGIQGQPGSQKGGTSS